jgi:hypothetical protein
LGHAVALISGCQRQGVGFLFINASPRLNRLHAFKAWLLLLADTAERPYKQYKDNGKNYYHVFYPHNNSLELLPLKSVAFTSMSLT